MLEWCTDEHSDPEEHEEMTDTRISVEVEINPETNVEPYDYGTGCDLRIGNPHQTNVRLGLGWDESTRRDACDRLIAALTEIRDWTPAEAPVPA